MTTHNIGEWQQLLVNDLHRRANRLGLELSIADIGNIQIVALDCYVKQIDRTDGERLVGGALDHNRLFRVGLRQLHGDVYQSSIWIQIRFLFFLLFLFLCHLFCRSEGFVQFVLQFVQCPAVLSADDNRNGRYCQQQDKTYCHNPPKLMSCLVESCLDLFFLDANRSSHHFQVLLGTLQRVLKMVEPTHVEKRQLAVSQEILADEVAKLCSILSCHRIRAVVVFLDDCHRLSGDVFNL